MTAVPEAAFLGWTEMREETEAMEDVPAPFPGLEDPVALRAGTLLDPARQLLFLLEEDEDEDVGDEDDVLETGDEDGEEGLEETDFGDSEEEDVVEEVGEHEVEMTIEFDPCS